MAMTMKHCFMAQEHQGEVLVHVDAVGDDVEEVEEEAAVVVRNEVDPEKERVVVEDPLAEAVEEEEQEEAEDVDLFKRKVWKEDWPIMSSCYRYFSCHLLKQFLLYTQESPFNKVSPSA